MRSVDGMNTALPSRAVAPCAASVNCVDVASAVTCRIYLAARADQVSADVIALKTTPCYTSTCSYCCVVMCCSSLVFTLDGCGMEVISRSLPRLLDESIHLKCL